MDQFREELVVTRCLHRIFGPQQWLELRDKLRAWRDSVAGVASSVATTRIDAAAQGTAINEGLDACFACNAGCPPCHAALPSLGRVH